MAHHHRQHGNRLTRQHREHHATVARDWPQYVLCYVETWKNGYTQYPSELLRRTVGVSQRLARAVQGPSDSEAERAKPARDLLQETLIEAHRNGLIYIAWFEYGFMAAHKSTTSRLREQKPAWLSRDIQGNEVAPNGFIWMNPLHPEARRFLLDLVLEAIDHYDLDGVQLDDRIVWPYVTMGYDDYTKQVYASEHQGRAPPTDYRDPAWMRWRADKVNEYAKWFVQEVRAKRPGLVISLSPAVYPWSWEYYLLEWPKWGAWTAADRMTHLSTQSLAAKQETPRWDEFVAQAYRFSYDALAKTSREAITPPPMMMRAGSNSQCKLCKCTARCSHQMATVRCASTSPARASAITCSPVIARNGAWILAIPVPDSKDSSATYALVAAFQTRVRPKCPVK